MSSPIWWEAKTNNETYSQLPGVSGLQLCAWTHLKKALCHTRPVGGTYEKYRLPPRSRTWQFSDRHFNLLYKHSHFVYMFCLFNTLVPSTFSFPCLLSGPEQVTTDRTLSGDTTPGQSGPGNDGNKKVLCIPQSSSITGASPSYCLVSLSGHSLEEVLPLHRDAVCVFCSPSQLGQSHHEFLMPIVTGDFHGKSPQFFSHYSSHNVSRDCTSAVG